ncbi:hypothetical protein J2X06_001254 [Lysobacter niastensis]|uniref:Uncharacterized protein n=1 Tax=Lysobacter niastensis TaxID=380629 RepID=A0ABU1W9U0_9GAMM|nr:hypothetical protein [Lysobacter niastensis]MDR7134070.1 hypothetical protein [Lysobacter niastensis]
MTTFDGRENPYQAPQAQMSQARTIGSPRRRFLLSCLGWFVPIPAVAMLLFYLLPNWILVVLVSLVVLWMATITWVIRAHRSTGLAYRATVAVGLTISLAICFALGSALLLAPIFSKHIDVTLPQRGT